MADEAAPSQRAQSPPRRQRACVPCSKAKARCNFQEHNAERHLCDRCETMGIICLPKSTKSLRKPRQIKPLNRRVSSLEKQLETLTAALEIQAGGPSSQRRATSPRPPTPEGLSSGRPDSTSNAPVLTPESTATNASSLEGFLGQRGRQGSKSKSPPPASRSPSHSARRPASRPASRPGTIYGLTWPQASRILDRFRDYYMHNFPYVVIPRDVSAQQLLEEKPFLFRVIMLVAAPLPAPRLVKMKRNVLAYLGQHMLVEDERNLELLQGLLICLSWAALRKLRDEQITNLTYLALGYAHNLGITRIPPVLLQRIGMDDSPEDLRHKVRELRMQHDLHSLDEQRAFLGCYCVLSVNSTQFGRQNPLQSQYIDLCCDAIKRAPANPSDLFMVRSITLTQIGEKISDAFGAAIDFERGKPYLFLLGDQLGSFRQELDTMMETLERELIQERDSHVISQLQFESWVACFTLQYNYLLVRLYEPATQIHATTDDYGAPAHFRSQCLQSCLLAAKAYFDTYSTLPPWHCLFQSVTNMEQVTFVIVIATRLLLLSAPDWDLAAARQTLNMVAVVDHLLERVDEVERQRLIEVERFVKEMGVVATAEEIATPGPAADLAADTRTMQSWFMEKMRNSGEQSKANFAAMGTLEHRKLICGRSETDTTGFKSAMQSSGGNLDDFEM